MEEITISLRGSDIGHMREMGRQQLLGDCEAVADCLAGRSAPSVGLEASERIAFTSRLLGQIPA